MKTIKITKRLHEIEEKGASWMEFKKEAGIFSIDLLPWESGLSIHMRKEYFLEYAREHKVKMVNHDTAFVKLQFMENGNRFYCLVNSFELAEAKERLEVTL